MSLYPFIPRFFSFSWVSNQEAPASSQQHGPRGSVRSTCNGGGGGSRDLPALMERRGRSTGGPLQGLGTIPGETAGAGGESTGPTSRRFPRTPAQVHSKCSPHEGALSGWERSPWGATSHARGRSCVHTADGLSGFLSLAGMQVCGPQGSL